MLVVNSRPTSVVSTSTGIGMRYRLVLALALGVSVGGAARAQGDSRSMQLADRGPAFFSVASPGTVRVDARDATLFRRFVALDVADATVPEALRAIEQAARVHIVYSYDLIPADARVTIRAERLSLGGALTSVLQDVPVDVQLSPDGTLALVRRGGAIVVPVARHRQATGIIEGHVTDSASARGIQNATVTLEATGWRALTDTSGTFTLRNVRPGAYRLMARLLGYRPTVRTITLGADSTVRMDLVLAKSVSQLDEVVTTGTVVPTEVKALPTPITVLSSQQLRDDGIQRIDQIFRTEMPGAVAWELGPDDFVAAVSVRGTSSLIQNDIKTYVDGVEITDPNFIAMIDPSSIDRIEVIRGPQASTIYGSNAISGVMQIFTKKGGPGLHVDGSASASGIQSQYESGITPQEHFSLGASGGEERFSYNLGGSYGNTGRWVPDYRSSDFGLFGGGRGTYGPFTLEVSGRYAQKSLRSVNNPAFLGPGSLLGEKPTNEDRDLVQGTFGLALTYQASSRWSHTFVAGYDATSFTIHQDAPLFVTPADSLLYIYFSDFRKQTVGYHMSIEVPLGNALSSSLTAGVDHYSTSATSVGASGASNTIGVINANNYFTIRSPYSNTGFFGQMQLGLLERLFVTAGVRADDNSAFGAAYGYAAAPRVGATYVVESGSITAKVRASYGKAIRPPTPDEKTASKTPTAETIGNDRLGPETQQGYDAGIDLIFGPWLSLEATYYNQTANGLIGPVFLNSQTSLPTFQYQNIGSIRNRGWELQGTARPRTWLLLRGNYSITHSAVLDLGPSYTGALLPGDTPLGNPEYSANATATVTTRHTAVALGVTHLSSWTEHDYGALYRFYAGLDPYRGSDRDYWIAYPAITKLNLSVSQGVTSSLRIFGRVDNLANQRRTELNNLYVMYGRRTTIGMNV